MADRILYQDKQQGVASTFPNEQKWSFQDANDVKDTVNNHASSIESIEAEQLTQNTDIAENVTSIAANSSGIATNIINIANNANDISTNTADISTNTSAISVNTTNISTNSADIATNQTNITNNTSDIATNASDISTNVSNISQNTADIAINTSGLAQEVLDRISGDQGTVNVHSDVDLNNAVSPIDGWVAKRIGGVLQFSMKEHAFYNGIPVINTTANTPLASTPLFWDFNFQRTGTYMISLSFANSYDATNSSMVVIPTLGGNTIVTITNGEILRKEPKEAGGNDGDGRGTSQKEIGGTMNFPVNVSTIGIQEFRLEHFGAAGGVEASIWNVSVVVEEIFNANIKN